jgi:Kef-type K+ transport system membrane component KefB/mannitol/fructose-specific phosphotransferase system IIA component (Ntr-type)
MALSLPIGALMQAPSIPLEEPVLIVALVMALVLVLPLLGRLLRIPDIILLILAGMLFGENGIGLLTRGQAIEVWGTVGLLYIMFLAGLEINVQDFIRNRNSSLVLGLLSFAVPQVAGTLVAYWFLGYGLSKAILLASMLASFTLLTYPQLSRLGLQRKLSVTVTLGGTLITDTLALLVLAIIVDLHGQNTFSWFFLLRLVVSFSVFVAVVLTVVPRLGRWFFRRVGRDGGAQFLFVLVVAFLCGSLSRLAGVEPIIGAFLAGLTLNRLVPPQSALMNRIEFVGRYLFIPFFLISVGMIVDPGVFLSDADTWRVGGVMVVTVFVTKWLASFAASHLLGYTRDEGWMIFGLTVTQAAATLAAVMVGVQLGIFDQAVLNGTLMMILATCMVSPWITETFGRRVALNAPPDVARTTAAETNRLLLPVNDAIMAARLMDLGILLRNRDSHEPLLPLRVVTSEHEVASDVANNEKMLFGTISQATAADVPVSPSIRVASGVAEGIRRAVIELRASTVLLGWPTTSGRIVFGGIFDDILHTCHARVVACRLTRPVNTFERMVLAVPPNAEREAGFADTLQLVWRLAYQVGVHLTVLCARDNRDLLKKQIKTLTPSIDVEWPEAQGWGDVRRLLLNQAGNHVLRILLTAREGGVSWRPGLERLPRALPAGDALLVYPELPLVNADVCPLPPPGCLENMVSLCGVLRSATDTSWETSLNRVLQAGFGTGSAVVEELCRVVRQAADEFPIELVSDVVLVHAHSPAVISPSLFVVVHPDGYALTGADARVVLVLLGPEGGPPDRHLQVLSALARWVRDADWVQSLIDAPDDRALYAVVKNRLQRG